ncbi:hypothetical protein QJS83_05470 [Bdellovibrio sp. 22V]|uniref:hypothetical protein n=1 Tax=Bdellovibrio TaxID=958 RepID=UPI0025432038|nr:hypothetical protein [Bdellovibrio sp. 22V]WII73318.1 hypothetical protein QJS83_05470 [Bdellovibrio sp. 22V]
MAKIPEDLSHSTYCGPCFDAKVAPELESYNQALEDAKNIIVFFKTQSKETRNFKRNETPFKVKGCADREETLLRLAFFAVKGRFNALIDVDITSEKVLKGRYQTQIWHGTAIPAQVTSERMKPS